MTVLKPRKRLLSFRVSDEEYEKLMKSSEALGARSTSDLVRDAMTDLITRTKTSAQPCCDLSILGALVEVSSRMVEDAGRLRELVASIHCAHTARNRTTVEPTRLPLMPPLAAESGEES